MVGWFVGQSVDGNQSIWENILESEKNDKNFTKERQDETQFTTKTGGKTCLGPSYFVLKKFHSQLRV